ncbi:MAG: Rieske (2Fe-2S) protein, partial [Porticoccaceae bacterium]
RDGRHIHCQVHGALFDIATGRCVAGPCAGKHLEAVTFRILDGDLSLDGAN